MFNFTMAKSSREITVGLAWNKKFASHNHRQSVPRERSRSPIRSPGLRQRLLKSVSPPRVSCRHDVGGARSSLPPCSSSPQQRSSSPPRLFRRSLMRPHPDLAASPSGRLLQPRASSQRRRPWLVRRVRCFAIKPATSSLRESSRRRSSATGATSRLKHWLVAIPWRRRQPRHHVRRHHQQLHPHSRPSRWEVSIARSIALFTYTNCIGT